MKKMIFFLFYFCALMSRLEVGGAMARPRDLNPCCHPRHVLPHAEIVQFDLSKPDWTETKVQVEDLLM